MADKLTAIIDSRIQSDRLVVPTMPAIAIECLKVISDPRQTFKSVGDVIAKDPVLSSRVLKLANSAAFPGLTPAVTLEAAIARMGIEGLTVILVQYSIHQAFTSRDERIRNSFRGIWEHSLGVALIAKDLASKLIPVGPRAQRRLPGGAAARRGQAGGGLAAARGGEADQPGQARTPGSTSPSGERSSASPTARWG